MNIVFIIKNLFADKPLPQTAIELCFYCIYYIYDKTKNKFSNNNDIKPIDE